MENDKLNAYVKGLKGLVGKQVKVRDNNDIEFIGKCLAINYSNLNVIIKKADGKIMILKNILWVLEE